MSFFENYSVRLEEKCWCNLYVHVITARSVGVLLQDVIPLVTAFFKDDTPVESVFNF